MNIQALHTPRPVSPKPLAVGLAGAALAIVTGLGIATVVLDGPTLTTPTTPGNLPSSTYVSDGTDRDVRELMHRR